MVMSAKRGRDTPGYLALGGAVGVVPHDLIEFGEDGGAVVWTTGACGRGGGKRVVYS